MSGSVRSRQTCAGGVRESRASCGHDSFRTSFGVARAGLRTFTRTSADVRSGSRSREATGERDLIPSYSADADCHLAVADGVGRVEHIERVRLPALARRNGEPAGAILRSRSFPCFV